MKHAVSVSILALALALTFSGAPAVAGPGPGAVPAREAAATAPVGTDPPITILGGRSLTECISAAPRPGCTTSTSTDLHQMAVFGILLLGVALIVWRVTVAVRRRDRTMNG